MAQSSFNVKNAADVDQNFTLISQDRKLVRYQSTDGGLFEPLAMEIAMDIKPVGANGSDRVTVAATHSIFNSVTGKPVTGRVSLQVVIPRDTEWESRSTLTEDLLAYVLNYMSTAGNSDKIIRAFVP